MNTYNIRVNVKPNVVEYLWAPEATENSKGVLQPKDNIFKIEDGVLSVKDEYKTAITKILFGVENSTTYIQYEYRNANGTLQTSEKIAIGSRVKDIVIDDKSIIDKDNIARIPKAGYTINELGVVYLPKDRGFDRVNDAGIVLHTPSALEIRRRNDASTKNHHIAVTIGEFDDTLIQSLIGNKFDLTEDQKIAATKWLGATTPKYVDEKFNGSNKAKSYDNYELMINDLNGLSKTDFSVGQNIMIVTLNVPDLWISSIEETFIEYQYSTDYSFKEQLFKNGYVQVGYFKLSALETQKVNLDEYQKKTDEALETKSKEIVGAINEVNEKVSQGGGTPTDVQINGESITKNGVANIPLAGSAYDTNGAVINVTQNTSLPIYATKKSMLSLGNNETRIASKNSENAIRNIDLDWAMVVGLTTNTKVLTDEEKAKAQAWLGVKLYQHEVYFRVDADNSTAYLRVNFITRSAVALTKNEIWQHLTNTDNTKGAMGYVMVTKDDNTRVYCPILYTLYAPIDVNIAYTLPDGTMGDIFCFENDIDYDPQWDDKVIAI